MNRFLHHRLSVARNQGVASTVRTLIESEGGYEAHKDALDCLLPLCGIDALNQQGEISTANRDDVLDDIRMSIEELLCSVTHSMKNLIEAHLMVVDAAVQGEVAGVTRPLDLDTVEVIGGQSLSSLVSDYMAVRDLLPEKPVSAPTVVNVDMDGAGLDMIPNDDVYEDLQPASVVPVLDKPTGSYVLRKIAARNNDTAQTLSKHFKCTVEELVRLNPKDAESGFGKTSAKLRKDAPVYVADYRTAIDGLSFF